MAAAAAAAATASLSIVDDPSCVADWHDRVTGCFHSMFFPIVASVPYLLRARQCIHEYRLRRRGFPDLWNATKYASAMPVIWLSALRRTRAPGAPYNAELTMAWVVALVVNTLFTFLWDVTQDWGFFRSPGTGDGTYWPGLKRRLLLSQSPVPYYLVIVANFVMRIAWSIKLSPHVVALSRDGVIFLLELTEVVRRHLWIYLRVEKQIVSTGVGLPPPRSTISRLHSTGSSASNADGPVADP